MIKAALTLHHRELAPQARLDELNPEIPFAEHRLRVITEAEPYPAGYPTAAASVNGFGYGGTNAHTILVEAPEPTPPLARQAPAQRVPDLRTQRGRRAGDGPGRCSRSSKTRRTRSTRLPGGHDVDATGALQPSVRRAVRRPRRPAVPARRGGRRVGGRWADGGATGLRRSSCSAGWVRSGGGWLVTCSARTGRSPRPRPNSTRRSPSSPAGR